MRERISLLEHLYIKLSSMRLTVGIFLVLAACSLIGTLLPQGAALEDLSRQYGPSFARWVETLGFNNLYHTGWFRFLLLFLSLNLIVCSMQRLPKTLKLIRRRDEEIHPEKLEKFTTHRTLVSSLSLEEVQSRVTRIVQEEFARLEPVPGASNPVFGAVAEKGRWSRLMAYVVHLSVLLILLGALLGSVFGFKGFMNLAEGEASNEVLLSGGGRTIALPFEVRCEDFDVSFYDTGAPKEFRSDLTVIDRQREVLRQVIRVNDPLTYEGVTFYQSSYGPVVKRAEVEFTDRDSGTSHRVTLPYRQPVTIPGTNDRVQVVQYQDNLHQFGRALGIVVQKGDEEPSGAWILADIPDFHGNRILNYRIRVLGAETGHYTGLQVKKDPGVWLVYTGFVTMLIGMGLAFYTSHRKFWVWAGPQPRNPGTVRVVAAGRTNKNSLAFEQEFNRICDGIERALGPGDERKSVHG